MNGSQVADPLVTMAGRQAGSAGPVTLVSCLASAADVGVSDRRLLLPLLQALPAKIAAGDAQVVVNALRVAARLGYRDKSYVAACSGRLAALMDSLTPRDCSAALGSLAVSVANPQLLEALI